MLARCQACARNPVQAGVVNKTHGELSSSAVRTEPPPHPLTISGPVLGKLQPAGIQRGRPVPPTGCADSGWEINV